MRAETGGRRAASRLAVLAFLSGSALGLAPPTVHAQTGPYDTEVGRELIAGGVVLTALFLRQLVFEPTPVGAADFDRPFGGLSIDAVATRSASTAWKGWTDRLVYGLMATAAGAAVAPSITGDGDFWPGALMFGETILVTVGATEVLKRSVARHRPYTYNRGLDDPTIEGMIGPDSTDARASFPSGHASTAFASATFAASVLTQTYSWPRGVDAAVWTLTLGAATATAYGRVRAGKHFPTDVLVGALVGGAVGLLVPSCHELGSGFCDLERMESGPPGFAIHLVSVPFG